MVVEFGDGHEPWSVARGKVTRWMHCRIDVGALPDEQRDELSAWLAGRDLTLPELALVFTRGDDGYRVHVPGQPIDVALEDLPVWLQRPGPPPAPKPGNVAKAAKARK